MAKKEIRVVIKRVGESPSTETIEKSLESYQKIVGGYIEMVRLRKNVCLICDEEGKLKGYDPNLFFSQDIIVGNVFFCSINNEDFDSLSDEQITFVEKIIKSAER